MDDQKMEEYLGKIGELCFVHYYDTFVDLSVPNKDIAAIIRQEQGYTSGSCATRVSKARGIIKAGRGDDALRLCL